MLSGIDDKIARIAALRAEIEALSNSIEQDRFYIATHRRLPPEVLGEIFAECAAHSHQWWLAPIVISHVSKHWRVSLHSSSRCHLLQSSVRFRTWFIILHEHGPISALKSSHALRLVPL